MKKIVQEGGAVLRQIAQPVALAEINSEKIAKIIAEMNIALDACDDGVALAAPQIGVNLRIFVVSGKMLPKKGGVKPANSVFINPLIKKISTKKVAMEEGCLSVRNVFGLTKRADSALIEAYNEKGHKFVRQGSGLMAQIFQHEIDHLNGILFIDQATNLQEINPEK